MPYPRDGTRVGCDRVVDKCIEPGIFSGGYINCVVGLGVFAEDVLSEIPHQRNIIPA
jgi:hypothetical protein